jgi:hypothetical protein
MRGLSMGSRGVAGPSHGLAPQYPPVHANRIAAAMKLRRDSLARIDAFNPLDTNRSGSLARERALNYAAPIGNLCPIRASPSSRASRPCPA